MNDRAEHEIISTLNQSMAERDERITAIPGSKIWRLTAPLRFASDQINGMRRWLRYAWRTIVLYPKWFDAQYYLKHNQDVATSGMDPYQHYVLFGKSEGRHPAPDATCNYKQWIRRYDMLTEQDRARLCQVARSLSNKPLISVVMPCYNPKPEFLNEAIESVCRQLYTHWELCIADDASTDPAIRQILEDYSRRDARIKVVYRTVNGHISAASNSALALATGEYVALLDHDDLLAEHALFWVAEAINRHPDAGLIYSDEDKVSESGQRSDPYFKCDWNYDLFLSQNMISHLSVYQAGLLRKIGGFREGFEGSQDYDLALRCTEQLDANQIVHIPRVLYHWRMHQNSTAQGVNAKPYAYVAAERALNEHLARKNIPARTERHPEIDSYYRVRYALPEPAPLVTLIIPTRNSLRLIRQSLSSILEKTNYPNYEILVIDNGSDDPQTLEYLDSVVSDPRLRILSDDRPFNFSTLNNRAVQAARGELVGLINNDIEVISPEWLTEMVSIALQPGVGCVGARLWYPDNTLQHGGVVLGLGGVAGHSHKHLPKKHPGYFGRAVLQQSFSAVTAACLVIRRSIFLEVGGMEERLKVAFGDVDFCLRVREAGYRNVWTPFAELYHHESATRGFENTPEKQTRFTGEIRYMQERWGSLLLSDPAYSPNLTLNREDFAYSCPPRVCSPLGHEMRMNFRPPHSGSPHLGSAQVAADSQRKNNVQPMEIHLLKDLYATHRDKLSDKWSIYLVTYQRLLAAHVNKPWRILEIGIQNGGSLEIWARYFPNATRIVGCDINPVCGHLQFGDPRISVVVGDANADETERQIAALTPQFDLVIDDGSHTSHDIVRSFARYFPRLVNGGIFVAEDLHCSYWADFEGGLLYPASSMAFLKRLADVINHEHWGVAQARRELLASFEREYGVVFDESVLAHIHCVEFSNSICVIHKRDPAENLLGPRVIKGKLALVEAAPVHLDGSRNITPDQSSNPWSKLAPLPEEKLMELRESALSQPPNLRAQQEDLQDKLR